MKDWVRSILMLMFPISLIGIIVYSISLISKGSLSTTESTLISILLAVLSINVTWFIAHIYAEKSHKIAIEEVKQFHKENLRTYALNAAEKVDNLSSELNSLASYLMQSLESEYDFKEKGDVVDIYEERIYAAVQLVNTLKSVNDTSLSDWKGVIPDEITERQRAKEEFEERINELVSRVSHLEDEREEMGPMPEGILEEIEAIKHSLEHAVSSYSRRPIPIKKKKKEMVEVSNECPNCQSGLKYRQRTKSNSYKLLPCKNCGKTLISKFNAEEEQFYLEEKKLVAKSFICPWCEESEEIQILNYPGTVQSRNCKSCTGTAKVSISASGEIRIKKTESLKGVQLPDGTMSKLSVTEAEIIKVKSLLPPQPWEKGIHESISNQLGLSKKKVHSAMNILMDRGDFKLQKNGVLFEPIKPT